VEEYCSHRPSQRWLRPTATLSSLTRRPTNCSEDKGADVRVRAFQAAPAGNLDSWYKQTIAACDSWQSVDSPQYVKNNMIVFAFSMDRKSMIMYGSNWESKLDSQIDEIRADDMNNQLRNGDFTGAIVESADAVHDALVNKPGEPSKAGQVLVWIMVVVIGTGMLIGIVLLAAWLVRQRRECEEARQAARQTALENRQLAAEKLGALDTDSARRAYDLAVTDMNDTDRSELDNMLNAMDQACTAALAADSGLDPEPESLTTQQYVSSSDKSTQIITFADAAASTIKSLEDKSNKLYADTLAAPETLRTLKDEYEQLTTMQRDLTEKGYRHDESVVLRTMRGLLDEAEAQIAAKRYGQALDELSSAKEFSTTIAQSLNWVSNIRSELDEQSGRLTQTLEEVRRDVESGTSMVNRMRDDYHESCVHDLPDWEAEARDMLSRTEESLASARQEGTMDVQNWAGATGSLEAAQTSLGVAQQFRVRVAERLSSLETVAAELHDDLSRVKDECDDAIREVSGLRGSQSSNKSELKAIQRQLNDVERELEQSKPPYLSIRSTLSRLAIKIEEVLDDAKRVHRRKKDEEEQERRRRSSSSSPTTMGIATGYGSTFGGSGFGGGGGGTSSGGGGGSSGGW
jgi:uncharacterized membrane protein YgcG